jgi:hypothetical protein
VEGGGVSTTICPHGDEACPCPDDGPGACHYEGADAWICPNPPDGWRGLTFAHCHAEGCSWIVDNCAQDRVKGTCGLIKIGALKPLEVTPSGLEAYSMSQAKPGELPWACGWIRTPLNVTSGKEHNDV